MATVLITDATSEALTAAEVRAWLRQDSDDSDSEIEALIVSVRQLCTSETLRSIMPTTWELVQDEFTDALRLEYPTITSVTSIKYIDTDGVEQTLDPSDYQVDTDSQPGWVVPAYGLAWPETRAQANAVRVRYVAGFANADAVPAAIKLWMKLHIAHFYRNKEAAVMGQMSALPFAGNLIDPYRVWGF